MPKGGGEPEEAAAEIGAGGRRKEIADEAIRETACVEVERLKPPFHEEWRKAKRSRPKGRGFLFYVGYFVIKNILCLSPSSVAELVIEEGFFVSFVLLAAVSWYDTVLSAEWCGIAT